MGKRKGVGEEGGVEECRGRGGTGCAISSPQEDHMIAHNPRNTSTLSTSTRGETTLVRKFIMRRITNL